MFFTKSFFSLLFVVNFFLITLYLKLCLGGFYFVTLPAEAWLVNRDQDVCVRSLPKTSSVYEFQVSRFNLNSKQVLN